MAADSTIKIGADISEVRRMLKEVPNLADASAQKTLIALEKMVDKAEKSAKKSAAAIRAANKAAGKSSRGAQKALSQTSRGLQSVAVQVPDVVSQLSAGTNAMTVFVQQGLQVVQVNMDILIGTFAKLGKFLLPMGGLIAATGAAYAVFASQSAEAAAESKLQISILENLEPLTKALETARIDLAVATGKMTDEEKALLDAQRKALSLFLDSTEELRNALQDRRDELREYKERLADAGDAVTSLREGEGIDPKAHLRKQIEEVTAEIERMEGQLKIAIETTKDTVKTTKDLIKVEKEEREALEAAREARKEDRKEAERQNRVLSDLEQQLQRVVEFTQFLTEGTRDLYLERKLQADLDALAPDDLISPSTITRIRQLIKSVDEIVPPKGLDKVDQLRLLLLQLEAEAAAAKGANLELASSIERVKAEIEKVENPDPEPSRTFWEVFTAGATAATAAAAGVAGAVSSSIDMFDRLLQLAGGFSLADLAVVAAEGGDVGAIVEEMVKAGTETVRVFVDSLPLVIDAFLDGLPSIIIEFIKAIDPVVTAIGAAVPEVLGFVVAALPGLANTVADLLTSGLFDQVIAALPSVIEALLDLAPDLITGALAAVGDLVSALIAEIPGITLAIIEALPDILQALSEGLFDLGGEVAEALIMELLLKSPELVAALVELLVIDLPVALAEGFIENIRGFFADLLTELKPGSQTTASFGDTPGPVVAPMAGLTARFAPGDTVIAAQDPQEALRQAQQAAGVSSSPQTVTLDLRDGHIAFDRMFRTNIRAGGSLSNLNKTPTGRVKVYG